MMKTSYSTIFNEGLDFSTVLLDRARHLIAEKNYTPSMMGAIPNTVRWTLEEFGEDYFQPGDVVVHNDPYRGNCHMPEHMMMTPDLPRGRAGRVRRQHRPPGRDRRQGAGLLRLRRHRRLPGRPAPAAGQAVRARRSTTSDVWRIILANHRTPRNTWGDFHAMIGALNVGERRFLELAAERYGADEIRRALRELIDYSERRLRAEIARAAGRRMDGDMIVEDDGVTTDPFEVEVARGGRGDEVIADFTGSEPAGPRADELHVRRGRLGRLQRRLLRDRPAARRSRATPAATARSGSSRRRARW